MPRDYVDNAMNRRLGRVGMPVGSMVHSQSSGSSGISSAFGTSGSFVPSSQSQIRTYVDNAYNRSHDRVGLEVGSKVIPASTTQRQSTSARGSSGLSAFMTSGSSVPSSQSQTRTYVDNAYNCSHDIVGLFVGSEVIPASTTQRQSTSARGSSGQSSAFMTSGSSVPSSKSQTRTYVDNAYNRSHDRVGLFVGSKVIPASSTQRQSTSTYVDNSYNRQHGRVGLEKGSKVISKDNFGNEPHLTKTYVDNSYNRQHGRVGLEKGSKLISKDNFGNEPHLTKTYVDNPFNRKHNRVGLEKGSRQISSKKSSDSNQSNPNKQKPRLYADTPYNRRLGRVGKIVGTSIGSSGERKVYADNPLNRTLGRVGEPLGSRPHTKKSKATKDVKTKTDEIIKRQTGDSGDIGRYYDDYLQDMRQFDVRERSYDDDHPDVGCSGDIGRYYDDYPPDMRQSDVRERSYDDILPSMGHSDESSRNADYVYNRMLEESEWQYPPRTRPNELKDFTGNIIPFDLLEIGRKIGEGGFGEVFIAKLSGTVVAVKKLLVQNLSKRRIKQFAKEIEHCSNFDHPNIVKYFGACVEMPNLAIVMEYLRMSLFDALHILDMELTEANRLTVIQYTIEGTKYLHDQGVAHCDLKTANVLMNYDDENVVAVKLADFGISMVKNNTQTSVSGARNKMQYGGTPRYSAPEVLRGEMLSAADMMKADIYSLALLIFEIIYEEEPFYDLSYAQLQKQVGEKHLQVSIPEEPSVDDTVINIIKVSWSANATHRLDIDDYQYVFSIKQNLYNSF